MSLAAISLHAHLGVVPLLLAAALGSTAPLKPAESHASTKAVVQMTVRTIFPVPGESRRPAVILPAPIEPAGIAYAPDGSLYIADLAGQRIWRLLKGRMAEVSGGGVIDSKKHSAAGNYLDGPLKIARFNHPSGLVAAGRSILIADTDNHVIRKLAGGIVTTVAGRQDDSSGRDGAGNVASFHEPVAMSYDSDGNLYVADHGVGLRKLSKDGSIVTVFAQPDTTGVSVVGTGNDTVVWWCGPSEIRRYVPASHEDGRVGSDAQGQGGEPVRFPYQIAALSGKDAVYSDPSSHTIRYFRIGNEFEQVPLVKPLIGPDPTDLQNTGGFRDGIAREARSFAPTGIAVASDGSIVFAEAGTGRLRQIQHFSNRHYIDPDRAGTEPLSRHTFRLAYVSNSFAFFDVLWHESIAGVIEDRLNRDAISFPSLRGSHVDVERTAGTSIKNELEYAEETLLDSDFDGVILGVNTFNIGSLKKAESTDFDSPPVSEIVDSVNRAKQKFAERKMFFVVVVHPVALDTAPWERFNTRTAYEYQSVEQNRMNQMLQIFRGANVDTLDATPAFLQQEESPERVPLFGNPNWHFTIEGNAVLGNFIADAIEREKLWSRR